MGTLLIGVTYVVLVVAFDVIDQQRLYRGVDARLSQRLEEVARKPTHAAGAAIDANAHDPDEAPVFFWQVGPSGQPVALTQGAPHLAKADAPRAGTTSVASLGSTSFRLEARLIGGKRVIAGQSLAESVHVENYLIALESVAGPVLLVAVFLGTLLIGIKAAKPVELARRRQLEFTADASHELRTPLSVIEAEVSLALAETREAGEYRDALGRVRHESARLPRHSRGPPLALEIRFAPPAPRVEPVDFLPLLSRVQIDLRRSQLGADLGLSVRFKGDIVPLVNAPPEWIDRLTGVLVDNACRYAGPGGMVRISVVTPANRVCLIVEDDGPGIAPDARDHLFDRFHRATAEGNGAGLGLAIGDAVVRATGGEWRVGASRLGGARMEVRWHRAAGSREQGKSTAPAAAEPLPDQEPVVPL